MLCEFWNDIAPVVVGGLLSDECSFIALCFGEKSRKKKNCEKTMCCL